MLFGTILSDLLGNACLVFIFLVMFLCWVFNGIFESEDVKDGVEFGFWTWFFSRDR